MDSRADESGSTDELDLEAFAGELETKLDEVEARLAEITRAPERGTGISFGKRVGDGTTEAVSRLTEVGVADHLEATREQVLRALEKIEQGSYGACDSCGAAIPAGRLAARPESVLCVECARAAD